MKSNLVIDRPGMCSTIQDNGRYLSASTHSFCKSGWLSPTLARLGNLLVGNTPDIEAIEFMFVGPSFYVTDGPVKISVVGDCDLTINNQQTQTFHSYVLHKGDCVDIKKTTSIGYVCVQGGININKIYGSKCTNVRYQLGSTDRPFIKGDSIPVSRSWSTTTHSVLNVPNFKNNKENIINVMSGAHWDLIKNKQDFFNKTYTISVNKTRAVIIFDTDFTTNTPRVSSLGKGPGTIVLMPNGKHAIHINDSDICSGYPQLAHVILSDLEKLIQLPMNSKIKFNLVDLKTARIQGNTYTEMTRSILSKTNLKENQCKA